MLPGSFFPGSSPIRAGAGSATSPVRRLDGDSPRTAKDRSVAGGGQNWTNRAPARIGALIGRGEESGSTQWPSK